MGVVTEPQRWRRSLHEKFAAKKAEKLAKKVEKLAKKEAKKSKGFFLPPVAPIGPIVTPICVDVPKTVCNKVPKEVCHKEPLTQCKDFPAIIASIVSSALTTPRRIAASRR